MAQIEALRIGDRVPVGRYWEQTFQVVLPGGAALDEWIDTGFDEIVTVVGCIVILSSISDPEFPLFSLNTAGIEEPPAPGALGIASSSEETVHITVRGKGA